MIVKSHSVTSVSSAKDSTAPLATALAAVPRRHVHSAQASSAQATVLIAHCASTRRQSLWNSAYSSGTPHSRGAWPVNDTSGPRSHSGLSR